MILWLELVGMFICLFIDQPFAWIFSNAFFSFVPAVMYKPDGVTHAASTFALWIDP